MLTEPMELNIDDIIAVLPSLNKSERSKLQTALFELQCDLDLKEAIEEGLDDVKNGRVSAHEAVIKEIKETYNRE